MPDQCSNCRFFYQPPPPPAEVATRGQVVSATPRLSDDQGLCRRGLIGPPANTHWSWPVRLYSEWCGEHKPARVPLIVLQPKAE